jgi:outer membrane receptor protein involved in Fe transport
VLGTEVFAGAVKTSFDATLDNQAYAAFGQVDWRATPTLQVSAGLRYSDETKRHRLLINNARRPASTGKLRDQDVSPSLIVQWRPSARPDELFVRRQGLQGGRVQLDAEPGPLRPGDDLEL